MMGVDNNSAVGCKDDHKNSRKNRREKRRRQQHKSGFAKGLLRRVVSTLIFLVVVSIMVYAGSMLWTDWQDDLQARGEYSDLRDTFQRDRDSVDWSAINPDYVGWISIPGTRINYPIVQGQDNDKYLHTTFSGQFLPAGAIFMDYRVTDRFDAHTTMIYGHNMRDGSMFAGLNAYLDSAFIRQNPEVIITTPDGEVLTYQIFFARKVYARDPVYTLDFKRPETAQYFQNAPEGATQFLLLSTCTDDGNDDARTMVYAAR